MQQYACSMLMSSARERCVKQYSIRTCASQPAQFSSPCCKPFSVIQPPRSNWDNSVLSILHYGNVKCSVFPYYPTCVPDTTSTPHFFSEVVRLLQMCIFMHMHCEVYNDTDFPVHKNTSALEFTEFLIKLVVYKASYKLL